MNQNVQNAAVLQSRRCCFIYERQRNTHSNFASFAYSQEIYMYRAISYRMKLHIFSNKFLSFFINSINLENCRKKVRLINVFIQQILVNTNRFGRFVITVKNARNHAFSSIVIGSFCSDLFSLTCF